jgi:uncharacterized Zn finger protein
MANAKDQWYYTAKSLGDGKFEFHKWDVFNDEVPTLTYTTHAYGSTAASCSCPAWRPCKHMRAIDEICDKGLKDKLHLLKWTERKGWEVTKGL